MKFSLIFILSFSLVFKLNSQIVIDNTTYSTTQLITDVLVPTTGGTSVSNVNFRGCLNVSGRYQAGYFTTATTTQTQMGFSSGVVLSTGNTADIPLTLGVDPGSIAQMSRNYTSGTLGEIRSSNSLAGQDVDADNLIAPQNYYNAAILEFDFTPVSSYMEFRYIFGSEEYDDNSGSAFAINYNCSQYNDKFAFLLSGPGISGGQGYLNDAINIARLSNSSEVGINSVNNGNVGSSGGAPNASNCLAANPLWVNGSTTAEFKGYIDGTELNGNTEILTASYSSLIPGQTYHIRLVIADANDGAYDSVVYLEESSFVTVPSGLPVEFIDFRGECIERGNNFEWFTASELNNDFYKLSRSTDAKNWEVVDTILSKGNSTSSSYYNYIHENRYDGINYFKLSQVDISGKEELLKMIAVDNNCLNDDIALNYYSRNRSFEVHFGKPITGSINYTLFDEVGKKVMKNVINIENSNSIQHTFPTSIENGIYYILLEFEGEYFQKSILIY